jgi:lysophospholipid acyltransferase (LPLAT)-like uncharacterized protein
MKWIRHFLKSDLVSRIFAFLAAQYIRLVFATCKWDTFGKEILQSYLQADKPFIICFWHGRLAMLVYAWTWKDRPFHMLLSNHRDGQLIGRTISYFNIMPIWGSTQRGGTQALREMLKILRKGETVGMTPDGPRGPRQVVGLGIITLAKLAQADMVPVTFSTSRRLRLNTWDRFHCPLPFGRGVFLLGSPISPPNHGDEPEMERVRLLLQTEMTNLQNKADGLMGLAVE